MNTADFLCDLLQELDQDTGSVNYNGFRLCHKGGSVELNALGHGGYEHFAQITQSLLLEYPVTWRFHRLGPLVELNLIMGEQNDVEVRMASGDKTDELNISDILGKLKEMYP